MSKGGARAPWAPPPWLRHCLNVSGNCESLELYHGCKFGPIRSLHIRWINHLFTSPESLIHLLERWIRLTFRLHILTRIWIACCNWLSLVRAKTWQEVVQKRLAQLAARMEGGASVKHAQIEAGRSMEKPRIYVAWVQFKRGWSRVRPSWLTTRKHKKKRRYQKLGKKIKIVAMVGSFCKQKVTRHF